ncbi:MAG: flagellar motor switch protein FliM [Bacillota bacterium]|nr:flagellar motor switch protein FliM [Bacillota bacterium]
MIGTSGRGGGAGGTLRVRAYDFRRPDKLSKDQLRTLAMINENFARAVTTYLSTRLRGSAQAVAVLAEMVSFEQFLGEIVEPAIIGVVGAEEWRGEAVMSLDPQVAFGLIDRLLGGAGEESYRVRTITEIEQALLLRLFRDLVQSWQEAWESVTPIHASLAALESNPLLAQVAPPGDMAVRLLVGLRLGRLEGFLRIGLPYTSVAPLMPALSAERWLTREGESLVHRQEEMRSVLRRVPVEMTALLGHAHLKLRDFIQLEVGDVILLDQRVGAPLQVTVAGRPKFVARPGQVGHHLAVEIVARLPEEDGESAWTTRS